ncbi:MAG: flagellar hook assembly protein FlgD [Alphaproteobacteria bacterium]
MVGDVTISTAMQQQQNTESSSSKLAEDFAQFLTLLTVQLQYQDPLSPMDSTEFTNQLVAFTGVEQQINTNQKLDSLVALSLGNSFSSSLNYVGKTASYLSREFYHDGTNPNTIKYALDDNALEAKIRILNEAGEIIYEENGKTTVGSHDFSWDGRNKQGQMMPAGTYEIRIDALDSEKKSVGSSTVVSGVVSGIETQNGAIFAIVGDRAVSVGNILNVSVGAAASTTPPTTPPPVADNDNVGDGDNGGNDDDNDNDDTDNG